MRHVNVHLAVASLALAGSLTAAGARADETRDIRKVLPLDGNGALSVENYKGSITVRAGTAAEASVEARIVPDGDDDASLRRARETEVHIDGGGRSVSVTATQPKSHAGWFNFGGDGSLPFVHITIKMPATASLTIQDYKSDTKLAGLKADLKIRTYKGTVAVQDQDGAVDLETYKGEVSIAFAALAKPSRSRRTRETSGCGCRPPPASSSMPTSGAAATSTRSSRWRRAPAVCTTASTARSTAAGRRSRSRRTREACASRNSRVRRLARDENLRTPSC
jgi:hypothetical protein